MTPLIKSIAGKKLDADDSSKQHHETDSLYIRTVSWLCVEESGASKSTMPPFKCFMEACPIRNGYRVTISEKKMGGGERGIPLSISFSIIVSQ